MRKIKPMFYMPLSAKTKADWLDTRIHALIFFGNGESDLDLATLLADYAAHHLDGQDGNDLGGEAG